MPATFGERLRGWRRIRRWSQEELAARAEVSPRHLSFLETGRSRPSREMVLRLCRHLDIPLRERNRLLLAAGYAPTYRESTLSDEAIAPIRSALDFLLAQHEPYPAVLMDRHWDIRLANGAADVMLRSFARGGPAESNGMRLLFDDQRGAASWIVNRLEVQSHMLARLHAEAERLDADARQRALYAEMKALAPDVPEEEEDAPSSHPLLHLHLQTAQLDIRLYTAITTLGTPTDVGLSELRMETYFPADEASGAGLRAWLRGASPAAG